MLYSVEEITQEIKICLDENASSKPLIDIGDSDALTFDQLVRSKIEDAARIVETSAPHHLLGDGVPFVTEIEWYEAKGKGPGRILLKEDFMRLVAFKMSDWRYSVTQPILEDSPEYAMQWSKWGGVRGNPSRPIVALIHLGTARALEFFSCNDENVKVNRARCIKYPTINEDDRIELCQRLHRAIVYYAAALVAQALQNKEQAEILFTQTKEFMV